VAATEHDLHARLARAEALTALALADVPADQLVALAARTLERGGGAAGFAEQVAEVLEAGLARAARYDRLVRREQHFVAAQRISHVGSYDFDIPTDTNDWSDQLFRIYGREPGSFMATYERFLEMVHPDDRDTIVAVHGKALAELSTYEMEERIVWPDGSVRILASWGEVVPDATGTPTRMVGICWDITEQKATATALQRSSERFQQLLQAAPDVVLLTDADGTVLQASACLSDVLGWEPDELVGRRVTDVLPGGVVAGETLARRRSGQDVPVDITTSTVTAEEGDVTVAFLRDVSDRKQAELLALRLHDDEVRRRHALEINDNVVQGLASVLYLLDLGRQEAAHAAARHTLDAARQMMNDLLRTVGTALMPGELVRRSAHVGTLDEVPDEPAAACTGAVRVLLADDADDIRLLLQLNLNTDSRFEVVGQAANGLEAVELARELQPDAIVLDLSMPVLDGLQAIPLLLDACPQLRIVVLSGFDQGRMRTAALGAGAHRYVEKGRALSGLADELVALFPDRPLDAPPHVQDPDASDGLAFDGDMVVHELRTPLTVVTGMLATLRDRMDVLPSATTKELVLAGLRNAQQMADLLDVLSDARQASDGRLPVVPELADVGEVVRSAVVDLCTAHRWSPPQLTAPDGLLAQIDAVRVRQVLANLLRNAYDFGHAVEVVVSQVDGAVEVAVLDDGPGVPVERRQELFGKFSRLGRQGGGMGLGLYISRALARAHGGDLVLRDGDRTTFVLQLPLRRPADVLPG
jgi:PAS domain S-box-containing protein